MKKALRVVNKLLPDFMKAKFSDSGRRVGLQQHCARFYVACLMSACGLPPGQRTEFTDLSIKRAFALASDLNCDFDWYVDKTNPTSDPEQWKNKASHF